MKILFLTEFYPTTTEGDVRGGVELRTYMVSQGLAERHQVTVVAEREPETEFDSQIRKVHVVRPGPVSRYRQSGGLMNRLRYLLAARKYVLAQTPDILFAENFGGYTIALTLPKSWRVKTILTYHDVWIGEWVKNVGLVMGLIGEVVERMVLRREWKHYVANSEITKKELISHNIAEKNISVVHNGIDIEACAQIVPEKFDHPTIVSVGRLVKYKRLENLLRALVEVRQSVPEVRLVVIGSGPEEKRLKALADQLGVARQVEWRGFVTDYQSVLAAIKGATVFSLPSAVEGFGIVTLEAMACGTPYVSSDIPPTREVSQGQGGILFPVGQVTALADGLTELLKNPAKRQQMGQSGKQRAQAYDWRALSRQLTSLVDSLA
ncbi:MAG: glycosyltransferase family 4 protein [Candidatus Kerfeldbacteria bacterium]|nr:glycosyltransferase family 4 protein [Candidatus Kerfeldbacteria bacterium]